MWRQLCRFVLPGALVAGPLAAVVMSLACSTTSPVEPITPTTTLAACRSNNSATVTFENRSASNRSYDVLWDGSRLMTLAPTQKSAEYTAQAGVTHSLEFRVTNSSQSACTTSNPILVVCNTYNYWCTY